MLSDSPVSYKDNQDDKSKYINIHELFNLIIFHFKMKKYILRKIIPISKTRFNLLMKLLSN